MGAMFGVGAEGGGGGVADTTGLQAGLPAVLACLVLTSDLCVHPHVCAFQLQIPSVKGFDFAKQHLGQHNKDDILIIHEPVPPPPPGPAKEHPTPSENGDLPSPKSKGPPKNLRHRGR